MYNGQHIKVLLAMQGKTSSELATLLFNNNRRGLTSVLNGNPTANTLEKIADFFKIPVDELFIREGEFKDLTETSPKASEVYINKLIESQEDTIKRQQVLIDTLQAENKSLKRKVYSLKKTTN